MEKVRGFEVQSPGGEVSLSQRKEQPLYYNKMGGSVQRYVACVRNRKDEGVPNHWLLFSLTGRKASVEHKGAGVRSWISPLLTYQAR